MSNDRNNWPCTICKAMQSHWSGVCKNCRKTSCSVCKKKFAPKTNASRSLCFTCYSTKSRSNEVKGARFFSEVIA